LKTPALNAFYVLKMAQTPTLGHLDMKRKSLEKGVLSEIDK
jgi:hypothetical protein